MSPTVLVYPAIDILQTRLVQLLEMLLMLETAQKF